MVLIRLSPKNRELIETLKVLDVTEDHIDLLINSLDSDVFVSDLEMKFIFSRIYNSKIDYNLFIEDVLNSSNELTTYEKFKNFKEDK